MLGDLQKTLSLAADNVPVCKNHYMKIHNYEDKELLPDAGENLFSVSYMQELNFNFLRQRCSLEVLGSKTTDFMNPFETLWPNIFIKPRTIPLFQDFWRPNFSKYFSSDNATHLENISNVIAPCQEKVVLNVNIESTPTHSIVSCGATLESPSTCNCKLGNIKCAPPGLVISNDIRKLCEKCALREYKEKCQSMQPVEIPPCGNNQNIAACPTDTFEQNKKSKKTDISHTSKGINCKESACKCCPCKPFVYQNNDGISQPSESRNNADSMTTTALESDSVICHCGSAGGKKASNEKYDCPCAKALANFLQKEEINTKENGLIHEEEDEEAVNVQSFDNAGKKIEDVSIELKLQEEEREEQSDVQQIGNVDTEIPLVEKGNDLQKDASSMEKVEKDKLHKEEGKEAQSTIFSDTKKTDDEDIIVTSTVIVEGANDTIITVKSCFQKGDAQQREAFKKFCMQPCPCPGDMSTVKSITVTESETQSPKEQIKKIENHLESETKDIQSPNEDKTDSTMSGPENHQSVKSQNLDKENVENTNDVHPTFKDADLKKSKETQFINEAGGAQNQKEDAVGSELKITFSQDQGKQAKEKSVQNAPLLSTDKGSLSPKDETKLELKVTVSQSQGEQAKEESVKNATLQSTVKDSLSPKDETKLQSISIAKEEFVFQDQREDEFFAHKFKADILACEVKCDSKQMEHDKPPCADTQINNQNIQLGTTVSVHSCPKSEDIKRNWCSSDKLKNDQLSRSSKLQVGNATKRRSTDEEDVWYCKCRYSLSKTSQKVHCRSDGILQTSEGSFSKVSCKINPVEDETSGSSPTKPKARKSTSFCKAIENIKEISASDSNVSENQLTVAETGSDPSTYINVKNAVGKAIKDNDKLAIIPDNIFIKCCICPTSNDKNNNNKQFDNVLRMEKGEVESCQCIFNSQNKQENYLSAEACYCNKAQSCHETGEGDNIENRSPLKVTQIDNEKQIFDCACQGKETLVMLNNKTDFNKQQPAVEICSTATKTYNMENQQTAQQQFDTEYCMCSGAQKSGTKVLSQSRKAENDQSNCICISKNPLASKTEYPIKDDKCLCFDEQERLPPGEFKVLKKIGEDSLLVNWKKPPGKIQGYEISVNGKLVQRIFSGSRCRTLVHSLYLKERTVLLLHAVYCDGIRSPGTGIVYDPSNDSAYKETQKAECFCEKDY